MVTVEQFKDVFKQFEAADEDYYHDYMADLASNARKGYKLALPFEVMTVPEWEIEIVEEDTDRSYDSYGDTRAEDCFIIFKVTDASGESNMFKLPGSYYSYEGWEWNVTSIAEVKSVPKTIYVWESI